jgi:hypothetical protein
VGIFLSSLPRKRFSGGRKSAIPETRMVVKEHSSATWASFAEEIHGDNHFCP